MAFPTNIGGGIRPSAGGGPAASKPPVTPPGPQDGQGGGDGFHHHQADEHEGGVHSKHTSPNGQIDEREVANMDEANAHNTEQMGGGDPDQDQTQDSGGMGGGDDMTSAYCK